MRAGLSLGWCQGRPDDTDMIGWMQRMLLTLDHIATWLMTNLATIPATFWGVVIGSFLTLLGVNITNRAGDRRQRAQFEHEFKLKKEERELTLRKDIYLDAAEAMHGGALALGSFANLDLPVAEITKGLVAKMPAVAKVHIIARQDTIKAVAQASVALSAALTRLTAQRMPLESAKGNLRILQDGLAGFEKDRDRWLEGMKEYNLAGELNPKLWETLQGNYNFEDGRITEAQAKIATSTKHLVLQQLDFIKTCVVEGHQFANLLVPAVLAMRAELGLPLDENEYRATLEEMWVQQQATLDRFLTEAKANFVTTFGQTRPALTPSAASIVQDSSST